MRPLQLDKEKVRSVSAVVDALTYWKMKEISFKLRVPMSEAISCVINDFYDALGGSKHA